MLAFTVLSMYDLSFPLYTEYLVLVFSTSLYDAILPISAFNIESNSSSVIALSSSTVYTFESVISIIGATYSSALNTTSVSDSTSCAVFCSVSVVPVVVSLSV